MSPAPPSSLQIPPRSLTSGSRRSGDLRAQLAYRPGQPPPRGFRGIEAVPTQIEVPQREPRAVLEDDLQLLEVPFPGVVAIRAVRLAEADDGLLARRQCHRLRRA